ncbi:PAS domain S-box protein [Mucilaginibacter ginsenosidivorax]|uniref:histidine kinase n=2 Tax=Mucilaginibacter ginsenosidivorax TaxID=862126 RepID=A0A5B8VSW1_9SPHI|nr:PAS domain S-box protein [Mucilaginibacter ginsenosidivorax]
MLSRYKTMNQTIAGALPPDAISLSEEKQAMLAAIVASSDDAIISKTTKGIITTWNPAAERMFGYIEAEAIGRSIMMIVPPDRQAEEVYIIGQILQGRKIEHFETLRTTKDGRQIPVSVTVSPILNKNGVIIGASKIARDISDRHLAREKQAILAAIVSSSDDIIISKTLQGIITSWNKAAEKIFAYTEAEAVGQHISLIIPPDRLSEEDFIIGQIANGRKVDHFETIRRGKNGQDVHLSVTVSPVVDEQGKIIGASKVARDISSARHAAENKGLLTAISNTSDDTIVSKTLEGIITSWNQAAEKMFGYSEEEALGQHISLIIPPERIEEETYIISEVSSGNKVDHFQTVRKAKDGRMVQISLSVSPILDDNGKIIGASKIARDISDHLRLQEEKAQLYDEIKALNDKKDEFIGMASHELKTPLTSIQAYLQILNNDMPEERRKDFLRRTGQQVKKLNQLVSDLLDISKIEAGKLQINPEPFDICTVVRDAIELITYTSPTHTVRFQTDLNDLLVLGDSQRIEQVILNLLTNAIRYAPSSKDIDVYLSEESGLVKVGVRDRGIGIPENKLTEIFSRFYRIAENKNTSGLGLGLYLARQIIERHHGRIWAESKPGEGSVFYFTLPIEIN